MLDVGRMAVCCSQCGRPLDFSLKIKRGMEDVVIGIDVQRCEGCLERTQKASYEAGASESNFDSYKQGYADGYEESCVNGYSACLSEAITEAYHEGWRGGIAQYKAQYIPNFDDGPRSETDEREKAQNIPSDDCNSPEEAYDKGFRNGFEAGYAQSALWRKMA